MVSLQRAMKMSRFENWKNSGISPTTVLPLLLLYEIFSHPTIINRENSTEIKLDCCQSQQNYDLRSYIINIIGSKALISYTMNIDLYLLNFYPLNPCILQTMSFVNSTCLKISRIIFCFKTISMKKLRLHIHEFKRPLLVLWPNSWSKLLFFFKKLLCFFLFAFWFFYPFYYLFTCFSVAIN